MLKNIMPRTNSDSLTSSNETCPAAPSPVMKQSGVSLEQVRKFKSRVQKPLTDDQYQILVTFRECSKTTLRIIL